MLDFLCIGPQRSGTTWLDAVMRTHSGITLPRETKETFFFDQQFHQGWDWYTSHFAVGEDKLCGEIAPSYFDVSPAVQRVRQYCPDTLIIVLLREPVSRAISSFYHHARLGQCSHVFERAVMDMPTILESSCYSKYLPEWMNAFGRDRCLLLLSEDISERPTAMLKALSDFLGVGGFPASACSTTERINGTSFPRFPMLARYAAKLSKFAKANRLHSFVNFGKKLGLKAVFRGGESKLPVVSYEHKKQLRELFSCEVDFAERMTGRSLNHWRANTESE
jgi:hypothetical protein